MAATPPAVSLHYIVTQALGDTATQSGCEGGTEYTAEPTGLPVIAHN